MYLKGYENIYFDDENNKLLGVLNKKIYNLEYDGDWTETEIHYDNLYDLGLVKFSDCFYDYNFEEFKKFNFAKPVLEFIVKRNGYMSFNNCQITLEDGEYILTRYIREVAKWN